MSAMSDGWASLMILFMLLIKQLLPDPQYCYSTNDAEHEIGKIAFPQQFDVQQMADKSTYIAANDADDKVHAASLALTAHNMVGYITYTNTCEYRPCGEICDML
jgi:hypothetical protein